MKKIYTLFFLLFICFAANAQLTNGKILLGGNVNFTTGKSTSGPNSFVANSYNVSPSVGLFYKENRMAGLNLSYGHAKNESISTKSSNYGAGVFLRQYRSLKGGFYFLLEEGLGYTFSRQQSGTGANPYILKTSSVGLSLKPGVSYAVKSNLQLELVFNDLLYFNYVSQRSKQQLTGTETKVRGFTVGSDLTVTPLSSIAIGVKFLLGK